MIGKKDAQNIISEVKEGVRGDRRCGVCGDCACAGGASERSVKKS